MLRPAQMWPRRSSVRGSPVSRAGPHRALQHFLYVLPARGPTLTPVPAPKPPLPQMGPGFLSWQLVLPGTQVGAPCLDCVPPRCPEAAGHTRVCACGAAPRPACRCCTSPGHVGLPAATGRLPSPVPACSRPFPAPAPPARRLALHWPPSSQTACSQLLLSFQFGPGLHQAHS